MAMLNRSLLCCCLAIGTLCLSQGCLGGHGWRPAWRRTASIPETYPLGSINRAHYHQMQSNAEASDFIFHRCEFVGQTAELTPDGKDHVLEVAARMRSTPYPVIIERSEHNSDPELDQFRREIVATILADMGNPDAWQRTLVAPAYTPGINSMEGEADYYRFIMTRGFGFGGMFGNQTGQFGGFGALGGGGGGIGFGP